MEEQLDIRWKQRFQNFQRAYMRLDNAVRVVGLNSGDELREHINRVGIEL